MSDFFDPHGEDTPQIPEQAAGIRPNESAPISDNINDEITSHPPSTNGEHNLGWSQPTRSAAVGTNGHAPLTPATLTPTVTQDIAYPLTSEPPDQAQEVVQPGSMLMREVIETILLTLLIFWIVNAMTGRFRIQGTSMLPTMENGQYVLINKLAYYLDEPVRGDIIVLHYPRNPSRDFIKRVIGLPGDVVDVSNNQVTVNGILLTEPYINASPSYTGNWTVPDDQFFVLGDNRNNSSDSHNWGFLPRSEIVGKAMAIYWPLNQLQQIDHYFHNLE